MLLVCNWILISQSSSLDLPIGTILPYVGNLADIPSGWHLCDGSNGTPNLSGRFLEGIISGPQQWHDAGLPNITGKFTGAAGIPELANGAFYMLDKIQAFVHLHNTPYVDFRNYGFSASNSNPIYGRSNTVQPASYTVYYIIRVR